MFLKTCSNYAFKKERDIEKMKELASQGYLPVFVNNKNWLYMVKNKHCVPFNGFTREEVFSLLSGLCSLFFLNRAVINKDYKMEILNEEKKLIRINCKFCSNHFDLTVKRNN